MPALLKSSPSLFVANSTPKVTAAKTTAGMFETAQQAQMATLAVIGHQLYWGPEVTTYHPPPFPDYMQIIRESEFTLSDCDVIQQIRSSGAFSVQANR